MDRSRQEKGRNERGWTDKAGGKIGMREEVKGMKI